MDAWNYQPARDLHLCGFERNRSTAREDGLVSSVLRLGWWSGVRLLLGVVNRLRVRGREHLPAAGPFLLVANHESHLDALVIASALPLAARDRIFPLAAGDVFFESPPLASFAAHCLNALPVWRKNAGRHALTDLRKRLLDDAAIFILFPEGGRSRDGWMQPFKPGVGMFVAGAPVPVVPCYLDGPFEAFPAGRRLPTGHRIRLTIGRPRTFTAEPNDRHEWERITRVLEEDVRALGALPW